MFAGAAGLAAVTAAVVVALVALIARGRVGGGASALRLVRGGAAVYAVLVLVLTVVAVVGQLTLDTIEVALPVQTFWPVLPEGVEMTPGGDARIVGGGFTETLTSVSGLGMGARALLAAGTLVQGLTQLAVTAAVFIIAHRLLAGEPFRPVVRKAVLLAAAALIGGGILWQVCTGIGQSMAANEVLGSVGWSWDESLGIDDPTVLMPEPRLGITIQFWPIFTGFALAAVAAAFRYGEALERDTVGLV